MKKCEIVVYPCGCDLDGQIFWCYDVICEEVPDPDDTPPTLPASVSVNLPAIILLDALSKLGVDVAEARRAFQVNLESLPRLRKVEE